MKHLPALWYPKAYDSPTRYRKIPSRPFLRAAGKNFLLLQLLFLGLFAYVFGSLFQQETHTHNLQVVFVDYDAGGAIGVAVREAYGTLQSDRYPTLVERSVSDFPTPDDLEVSVCGIQYWAALYTSPGASQRLQAALSPNSGTTPAPYNATNALSYIWNQARYSTVVDAAISSNLHALSEAARVAYMTSATANGTTSSNLTLAAQPWTLTSNNLKPTSQGSRAIYNTLVIILIIIQEFFYLGTINGLYAQFKCFTQAPPHHILLVRVINSALYCLVGSLCVTGTIWAFRSGWDVSGLQFFEVWMALWLFAHVNFQTLDVFTVWLPPPFVPMSLIAWIVVNVSSILLPLELAPGWYKVGLALPAHQVYQTLLDVWSGGCNPRLHVALPVLFAWEVVGFLGSGLGVYRRAHYGVMAEAKAKEQFGERVDSAVEYELGRRARGDRGRSVADKHGGGTDVGAAKEKSPGDVGREARTDGPMEDLERAETLEGQGAGSSNASTARMELEEVIRSTDRKIEMERRASKAHGFGPFFELPFAKDVDSESSGS